MRAQEEAKKREKMERLGIDVPGMQGGFNGPGSPPGRPSMMGPPPPYGVPPQQQFNAGSPGSMRNGGEQADTTVHRM